MVTLPQSYDHCTISVVMWPWSSPPLPPFSIQTVLACLCLNIWFLETSPEPDLVVRSCKKKSPLLLSFSSQGISCPAGWILMSNSCFSIYVPFFTQAGRGCCPPPLHPFPLPLLVFPLSFPRPSLGGEQTKTKLLAISWKTMAPISAHCYTYKGVFSSRFWTLSWEPFFLTIHETWRQCPAGQTCPVIGGRIEAIRLMMDEAATEAETCLQLAFWEAFSHPWPSSTPLPPLLVDIPSVSLSIFSITNLAWKDLLVTWTFSFFAGWFRNSDCEA